MRSGGRAGTRPAPAGLAMAWMLPLSVAGVHVKPQPLMAGLTICFVVAIHADTSSAQPGAAAPQPGAAVPASEPRGLLEEPRQLTKGLDFAGRRLNTGDDASGTKTGFYPELGNMVTGAGWISAGLGYRHFLFDDRLLVEASTAISWRAYKMAQARIELTRLARGRVAIGTQVRWQDLTQITYFGQGADSRQLNRSEYRLESLNHVGYITVRPREWLALNGRVGWLSGPHLRRPAGTFLRDNPPTDQVFPNDQVFQLPEQPDYVYGESGVTVDTRDEPGYPTRGGFYRAVWTRYSDRDAGRFSFQRYQGEAAHFIPLADRNVVLALHGWVVGTTTADDQQVPFYLLPSLGGANTLRGFSDYRFHDRDLAVVNAETRVAIFEHIDGAAFFDAGSVAARFGDLDLGRTSYGMGLRVHGDEATYARLDIARSVEGWRIVFRLNDPFGYSRLRKRTAQAPFAP
jgi:hypothetical protein